MATTPTTPVTAGRESRSQAPPGFRPAQAGVGRPLPASPRRRTWRPGERASRLLAALAAADIGVHLAVDAWEPPVGSAARRRRDVASRVTQSLALPLMGAAWASRPGRRVRGRRAAAVTSALAWSWVGDTAPALVPGRAAFPVLMASFLPAQWSWSAAFLPARRRSALSPSSPAWPLPAVALVAAATAVGVRLLPGQGALAPAGALYAASLLTQALLASGAGPQGVAGGALFVVSDSAIALGALGGRRLPKADLLVMSTYLVAQALLLAAVERDAGRDPA